MRRIIFLCAGVIFLSGCAAVPVRKSPQFANYFQAHPAEKAVIVMPIDIKFYKLTAGGVSEQMDEWDAQSDALFRQAISRKLDSSPNIKIKILEESGLLPEFKKFLDEQNGLYRAVSMSIIGHTYMPGGIFRDKIKEFDYTLGPDLGSFNNFMEADALLFLSGSRTYWTGGRVALAVWGIMVGAATGVVVVPASVPDWVSVSLVDVRTGNILWFKYMGQPNTTIGDLRDERIVEQIVNYLFRDIK